jgi:hypothetical protein
MLIATIANLMTSEGRAYLRLLRARRFAVGRIGAGARVPYEERSLALLLRQPDPGPGLLTLLREASVAGQLYALLGLWECQHPCLEGILVDYRLRMDEVPTQVGCFVTRRRVRDLVAEIEDGTCSLFLQLHQAQQDAPANAG